MNCKTWETYKFHEVTLNLDKKRIPLAGSQRTYRQGKYPYYGAQGIIDYIDDYIFDGTYLLIAEDGENLRSKKQSIATLAKGRFWVNNHAHIICNSQRTDIIFLYYLINSMDLSGYITGSAQPKLSQANLNNIALVLPPLPEQRAIAATLSSLDDKIELNNRMNKTLEEMAQAIFKSWFVDFEPFQNGEFVDSELGRIPKGWRMGTLGEIISTNLMSYSSNECWSYVDYLNTGSITENAIGQMQKIHLGVDKLPSRARRKVQKNDIVYSTVRPIQKHYGIISNPSDNMLVSTGFAVIRSLYAPFVYCYLTQQSIIEHLDAIANQSVSTYPSIRADHIESLRLCIPPKGTLDHFCSALGAIYQFASAIQDENNKLSTIRDSLLPKLMNGEICVPINP